MTILLDRSNVKCSKCNVMGWIVALLIGTICGSTFSNSRSLRFFIAKQKQSQQQQQHSLNSNILLLPLAIPQGKAVALPSILIPDEESAKINREFYGGAGDKVHLGGFTEIDTAGISPKTWKYMVTWFGIRSILDVGCGRGISTTWFLTHGVDALCIEGSHDARLKTMLPNPDTQMIEHDYSRGPWWPDKTYDAVWCVEFLEHVGRNFQEHYIPTFRKAAIIFATHSRWGGWHHVEIHENDWWMLKMESFGFRYSALLTQRIKDEAAKEDGHAPTQNGDHYNAGHISGTMQVFINPIVASLPQHAHLFAEPGCFEDYYPDNVTEITGRASITRPCGLEENETPLPDHFKPLPLTPEMDQAWDEILKQHLTKKRNDKQDEENPS